jgi:hypothetical protein
MEAQIEINEETSIEHLTNHIRQLEKQNQQLEKRNMQLDECIQQLKQQLGESTSHHLPTQTTPPQPPPPPPNKKAERSTLGVRHPITVTTDLLDPYHEC